MLSIKTYSILIRVNLLEEFFDVALGDVLTELLEESLELGRADLAVLVLVATCKQLLAEVNVLFRFRFVSPSVDKVELKRQVQWFCLFTMLYLADIHHGPSPCSPLLRNSNNTPYRRGRLTGGYKQQAHHW